MHYVIAGLSCFFLMATGALAHEKSHDHHQVPTLNKANTVVKLDEDKVTITFGPHRPSSRTRRRLGSKYAQTFL